MKIRTTTLILQRVLEKKHPTMSNFFISDRENLRTKVSISINLTDVTKITARTAKFV